MEIERALEKIMGPDRVSSSEAVCQSYQYNADLGKDWVMKPDIVVLAETPEQVSEVIKAANQYKVPVATKGTMGGGGLGGNIRGGILLDLSLMEKIISIDVDNMKAVAEAGCSFFKFAQELFKNGLMLPTPMYLSGPSVAASVVTPGIGLGRTRYGLNVELVEGLEVVLPSGEITRVGSMAYADTDFGPFFRYITGPDLVGLFTKSNGAFGIITKVAYRCLRLPKHWGFHAYYWPLEKLEDVTKTLMQTTSIEVFDIALNDKYRWDWEGPLPFDMPEDNHFDVMLIVNADNEQELKGKEQAVHDICSTNGGTYLPGLAEHFYRDWPTVLFCTFPPVPPETPNIMTTTLGKRSYHYILDQLMFPTSRLTDVYTKTLELYKKYKLAQLPKHPVLDAQILKQQTMAVQCWVNIDEGSPEWVERFEKTRDDFRQWYGERGGLFQTRFPPLVPEYAWTSQLGAFNLLKSIKQTLDPNDILSPGTFELGSRK